MSFATLGLGLVRWRRRRFARLLAAFGLALLFLFRLDSRRSSPPPPAPASASSTAVIACWIFASRFSLVAGPIRHLVAALVLAESLVLFQVNPPPRRLRQHAERPRLSIPPRVALPAALITHRFMFPDAFALIFVPSSATWPSLTSPARLAQLPEPAGKQRAERLQMPLAEVADRAKIRRIERHNHHKIVPFAA